MNGYVLLIAFKNGFPSSSPHHQNMTTPVRPITWLSLESKLTSGMVMDVPSSSMTSGCAVENYTKNGGDNQKVYCEFVDSREENCAIVFTIVFKHSTQYLGVGNLYTNCPVVQLTYDPDANIYWVPEVHGNYFALKLYGSTLYAEIEGSSMANCANIRLNEYNGGDNQLWKFIVQ